MSPGGRPSLDLLLEIGLPGLVFVGLCGWLIRKVLKAARTEQDLEDERLSGALADELRAGKARAEASLRPNLVAVAGPEPEHAPAHPLAGADARGADPTHLPVVAAMVHEREQQLRAQHSGPNEVTRRVEVLWVRSNATHVVWCERRHAATLAARGVTREVICVAQVEGGVVLDRWSFG